MPTLIKSTLITVIPTNILPGISMDKVLASYCPALYSQRGCEECLLGWTHHSLY